MSDYGIFESIEGSSSEKKIATRQTQRKLDAAIDDVKNQYGSFLYASRDGEEWNDRVALCKDDMLKTVNAHLMPVTGVMRRIVKACKDEWKSQRHADKTGPAMDNDVTFAPKKDKELKPKDDWEGYLSSVDQSSDEAVDNCFKEGFNRLADNGIGAVPQEATPGLGGGVADPVAQAPEAPMGVPGIQAARQLEATGIGDSIDNWMSKYVWQPILTGKDPNAKDSPAPKPDGLGSAGFGQGAGTAKSGIMPNVDKLQQGFESKGYEFGPNGVKAPGNGGTSQTQLVRNNGGQGGSGGAGGGSDWKPNGVSDPIVGDNYEIQKGDTLTTITDRMNKGNGTNYTVQDMAKANNISNPDFIKAGDPINSAGKSGTGGGASFNPAGYPLPDSGKGLGPANGFAAPANRSASLALNQYMDWCDTSGLRRASVNNLDIYASNLDDQAYFEIASAITDPSSPIYVTAAPVGGNGTPAPQGGGGWDNMPKPIQPGQTFDVTKADEAPGADMSEWVGGQKPLVPGASNFVFPHLSSRYVAMCREAGVQPTHEGMRQFIAEFAVQKDGPTAGGYEVDNDRLRDELGRRRVPGGGNQHKLPKAYASATPREIVGGYIALCRESSIQPSRRGLRQFIANVRTAAPDYLQKADEALTNLLNQKAEEFQETIAPLQQALQTVQQAEQAQQAANPLGVQPPAGTVNVLPQQGDPSMGGGDPSGGGMPPGGGDPSMGGGDPQQMMARRRNASEADDRARSFGYDDEEDGYEWTKYIGDDDEDNDSYGKYLKRRRNERESRRRTAMPMTEDGYVDGGGWIPGQDFDPNDPDEMEIMRHIFEQEKMDADRHRHVPEGYHDHPDWEPHENEGPDPRFGGKRGGQGKGRGAKRPIQADVTNDFNSWMKGRGPGAVQNVTDAKDFAEQQGYSQRGYNALQGKNGPDALLDAARPKKNPLKPAKQPVAPKGPKAQGPQATARRHDARSYDNYLGPLTDEQKRNIDEANRGKNFDQGDYNLSHLTDEEKAEMDERSKKNEQRRKQMERIDAFQRQQNMKGGNRKQANFFTRKVAGWQWDDHLNGYISDKPNAFTCKCGSKHNVPSYSTCKCGKIWNSYVIGTGGDRHQAAVEKFICREIPVRENVIVAQRKTAKTPEEAYSKGYASSARSSTGDIDAAVSRYKSRGGKHPHHFDEGYSDHAAQWPHRVKNPKEWEEQHKEVDGGEWDAGELFRKKSSHKTAKGKCECWEGYERVPGTEPCAEGSCRKCDGHRKAMRLVAEYKAGEGWKRLYDERKRQQDRVRGAVPKTPWIEQKQDKKTSGKVKRHKLSDPGPLGDGKDDNMPDISENLGSDWYKRGPGGKYTTSRKRRSR